MGNEKPNKDTFRMTYSANEQEEVREIRQKYMPKEKSELTDLERLRQLDASVGKKATTLSLIVGIVGTLLLGLGMSMLMSEFGVLFGKLAIPLGIGIGVVGIAVLACAYPVYLQVSKKEKEKIAPEILRLTDTLLK